MLFGFVVCVLVAMAGAKAVPSKALYGILKQSPPLGQPDQEHEPCCGPRYYTFSQTTTVSYVNEEGGLGLDFTNAEGAYDGILDILSVIVSEDFYNGTVNIYQAILDYKKGVGYDIEKTEEGLECFVSDITGEKYEEDCVPKGATFVGEVTLGDYAVLTDNWYYSPYPTKNMVKIVQHEGCIPMGLLTRVFHPETGEDVELIDTRVFNFNLGICDPEKYFKVPDICKQGRALATPTAKMVKMRSKGLQYH